MSKIRQESCDECEHSYMNRCCLCVDIRTGVIILGLVHLVVQVASIIVMCQVLLHPDAFEDATPYIQNKETLTTNNFLTLVISLLLFTLTAFMVYGTIKRRPGYLLPFFCLQVFDLCVCIVILFGAVTNHDQVVIWKSKLSNHYGYMKLNSVNQRCLFATLVAVLLVKGYLANCVWTCYKLFIIRLKKQEFKQSTCCTDSDFETLLPNYNDATKATPKESPPPYIAP